jgi:hypothetical protein
VQGRIVNDRTIEQSNERLADWAIERVHEGGNTDMGNTVMGEEGRREEGRRLRTLV